MSELQTLFFFANKTYVALQFKLLQKLLIHTGYKQLSPFRNKEELSFLLNGKKINKTWEETLRKLVFQLL